MSKPGNTGIRRILRAAVYSAQGFAHAWKHEAAFRQEVALTVVLMPIAIWLGQTVVERAALIGVCLIVLIVEFLNSAVQAPLARFREEQHQLSGRAQDPRSPAALLSLAPGGVVRGAVAYARFAA